MVDEVAPTFDVVTYEVAPGCTRVSVPDWRSYYQPLLARAEMRAQNAERRAAKAERKLAKVKRRKAEKKAARLAP